MIEEIEDMLDNIDGAGIPSSFIEYHLMSEVNKQLGSGLKSEEEMAEWILIRMKQYKDDLRYISPFDETEYIENLLK